jgi:tRNA threonylcarbamoyladenosine biosynthesis protein TsaB
VAYILAIESSTKNCSVALFHDLNCLMLREEVGEQFIHSEMLHLFVEEVLASQSFSVKDLDAIAVGSGPGSYTGLRIGLSSAKGLAFALGVPLISENGLAILSHQLKNQIDLDADALLMPMIDARRMEVYMASYSATLEPLSKVRPEIIESDIFTSNRPHYFFGDGATKFKGILQRPNYHFPELFYPSALALGEIAFQKFVDKDFEDLAYFEPLYVKNFQAMKPKKLL